MTEFDYIRVVAYDYKMISPNHRVLAEKDTALLEKLNFDPQRDDPFELDNLETFQETGLFCKAALARMFDKDDAKDVVEQTYEADIPASVGMLLVRPDMVHIAPKIEQFIGERFSLLDVSDITVTPEQYWSMYEHVITSKERTYSRLTRAAIYLNSQCRLMVFERAETEDDGIPAPDHLFEFKDKQGIEEIGTLRGDIIYGEALKIGLHKLEDPQIAHVADPFGAYRKIERDNIKGLHSSLEHPLLFYTAVGVHIPDSQERFNATLRYSILKDIPTVSARKLLNSFFGFVEIVRA